MYRQHKFAEKNTKDFIGVGDPYIKKKEVSSRFKSKQFQTKPPKRGQNEGCFDKTPEYKGDTYIDTYKAAPKKFKNVGFGSNDADRRSEFTMDVFSKQWREKMIAEGKHRKMDDFADDLDPEMTKASFRQTAPYKMWFQTCVPIHGVDIGKADENGYGVTPICNKCSRDTFYCKHRIKAEVPEGLKELRRPQNGGMSPTSYNAYGSWNSGFGDVNNGSPKYVPTNPKAGRVRTTKQFFDSSHLVPGWSAS